MLAETKKPTPKSEPSDEHLYPAEESEEYVPAAEKSAVAVDGKGEKDDASAVAKKPTTPVPRKTAEDVADEEYVDSGGRRAKHSKEWREKEEKLSQEREAIYKGVDRYGPVYEQLRLQIEGNYDEPWRSTPVVLAIICM